MQTKVNIFIKVLQIWNWCITFTLVINHKHHEPQTHRSTVFKNHRKVSTGRFVSIPADYYWLCFNCNNEIMETKYTPGPWSIRYLPGIDMEIISRNGKICSLSGFSHSIELMDENEAKERANAQLIAAAPDLLEALEELQEKWTPASHYWGSPTNEKVDLALKKAKGL